METMTTRRRLEPVKFERKCQIYVGFFPVKRLTYYCYNCYCYYYYYCYYYDYYYCDHCCSL